MRDWLPQRIVLGKLLVLSTLWIGCNRAPTTSTTPVPSDALASTRPDQLPRVIPRRSNPIVVTNVLLAEPEVPVVTNRAPTITCGPVQTFPCASADGVQATVAVHVEDADGDALSVVWNVDGRDRYTQQVAAAATPPTAADLTYSYSYTPGDHGLKVTVTDGTNSVSCETSVTVQKDAQRPTIACPQDIVVPADPGRCSALVTFDASASDNCPDVVVNCDPPSGAAFPVGQTVVTCTAVDTAGNANSCAFNVVVQVSNMCPRTADYWRQNAAAWPISSVRLGNQVYNRNQMMGLLHATVPGDASVALARQLITACLNTAAGSDPLAICTQLNQAHDLLSAYSTKVPLRVNLATPEARPMMAVATALSGYNSGLLNPGCVH